MPFIVVAPPKTEQALAEAGKKIVDTAGELGRKMNVEGFLRAWLTGVRVIAETDSTGKYIGLAFLALGDRWLYDDSAMSLLYYKVTDTVGFFSFVKTIATVTGASKLIYEKEILEETPDLQVWKVHVERL